MARRPRTLIAAVLALALAAGAGFLAVRQNAPTPTLSANGDWSAAITACIPDVPIRNGVTYEQAGARDCLIDVMGQAYSSGNTAEFSVELQKIVDVDDALYNVCHNAAHSAGLNALAELKDPVAALDAVAESTVCDWGMGHGVLDSLSEQNPPRDTFDDVSAWCLKHADNIRLHDLCADGLGHLAWGATKDFDEAILLCESVGNVNGRTACGGGILMQVFAPAAHSATYPLDEATERLPDLCADWASKVSAEGAANGCYAGAAYLFSLDIKDQIFGWWNSDSYRPGIDMPEQYRSAISKSFTRALEACRQFPEADAATCEGSLANNIPTRFAVEHPVEAAAACRIFADDYARKTCSTIDQRIQQ